MEYPTYLIHYGIPGQKWYQRRFQNEDGTYTKEGLERRYTKEGYKSLKKDYKRSKREANKEYIKVVKESGKNRLLKSKVDQRNAIDKVDEYASNKAKELFDKYKDMKIYKAKLKGKDIDVSKIDAQYYFEDMGLDPGILGVSYPTLTSYIAYSGKDGKTKVHKQSIQYYYSYN